MVGLDVLCCPAPNAYPALITQPTQQHILLCRSVDVRISVWRDATSPLLFDDKFMCAISSA